MEEKVQEDIDLIYVIKSLRNGVFTLYTNFLKLISFSFKKIYQLLAFILFFCGLFLVFYFLQKPYYVSNIYVSHIRLENDYCIKLIYDLDSRIHQSSNNKELAKALSIDTLTSGKIKSIIYKPLNTNIANRFSDSTVVLLPFIVEVEVFDNSVLPTLQKAIMTYLENNEFAKQSKEIENNSFAQMEARLDWEIRNLDSLKQLLNKSIVPQSTGNGIILGEPINPIVVYDISIKLYEKKLQLNEKQKLNDSFRLMVGFPENKDARKPKTYFILLGILTGYVTGMIFLLRKKLAVKN